MKRKMMQIEEKRKIALQGASGQLRYMGIDPDACSAEDALKALDDLYRSNRSLIASEWYGRASDTQIKLFKREWNSKRRSH